MPTANKGVLVKCQAHDSLCVRDSDPATKQYLLHLNETAVQQRFVIEDLDDRHLFIVPDQKVIAFIEKKMDEWNEKNTYQPPTQ
ncbi:hypothetical protein PHYPSEUDO_008732 [Phytophthora pseudosyringae]|uniref:General transcription and DNA repair factor IIH subunit TFB5 n=1 Tax=Phytophthora pseudosyringae TaxID=221518 RepID=A0A8T1VE24_9STRA|nr:hypothetical protein PHYPSEUDO_008732 [Phytophthora pseudosyringae]